MPENVSPASGPAGAPHDPFHSRDTPDAMLPQHPPGRPGDPPRAGRVVVGIDGSEESRSALRWAVRHAQRTGSAVHALAVWHQPVQFGVSGRYPVPAQEFEAEARSWLSEALPTLAPDERGAEVHARTAQGDPSKHLLEHSQDAELLVLGNHGRSGVSGALLGSVAQRCAQHARCPVVLVPALEPGPGNNPQATAR